MSDIKAPKRVAKFVVPLNTVINVVAVIVFMLNTVVKYTNRFDNVPIAPSFSNVSFPVISSTY